MNPRNRNIIIGIIVVVIVAIAAFIGFGQKSQANKTVNKITDKTSDKLPQTGQLWWPVLVLLFAGAICLLVGRVLRDRKEEKNR